MGSNIVELLLHDTKVVICEKRRLSLLIYYKQKFRGFGTLFIIHVIIEIASSVDS